MSGTVKASDILKYNYMELRLSKNYQKILGHIPAEMQWNMLIHGIAGSGKSTYSLRLSQELTRFGLVLYGNFEEAIGPTLKAKLKTTKISTHRISYLRDNTEDGLFKELDSGMYKYCVLDSLTQIAKTEKRVDAIWERIKHYKNVSFIFISHALKSKDGKKETTYKGSSSIGHSVDILQHVIRGVVWNDKNRLLGRDCNSAEGFDIFRQRIIKARK